MKRHSTMRASLAMKPQGNKGSAAPECFRRGWGDGGQAHIDVGSSKAAAHVDMGMECEQGCRASPWRGHASLWRARRPGHAANRCIAFAYALTSLWRARRLGHAANRCIAFAYALARVWPRQGEALLAHRICPHRRLSAMASGVNKGVSRSPFSRPYLRTPSVKAPT